MASEQFRIVLREWTLAHVRDAATRRQRHPARPADQSLPTAGSGLCQPGNNGESEFFRRLRRWSAVLDVADRRIPGWSQTERLASRKLVRGISGKEMIGTSLNQYRITTAIGAGGMGEVF